MRTCSGRATIRLLGQLPRHPVQLPCWTAADPTEQRYREEKTAVDAIKKRDLLNWNIGEFQLIESATEGIILCRVIKNGFLIRWWECGRSTVGLKTLALKC